jgi:hypothetical protein
VSSRLYYAANMPEHDQVDIRAQLPSHGIFHPDRLGVAGPCAIPGISLTDYSRNPEGKGWGPHCTGPFTTITLSNGVRLTCDHRVAELNTLVLNQCIRGGYTIRQSDTGCYVCRHIAGTTIWSNHAWGLADDIDWSTNPQRSPLTTDEPVWMWQLFNRYGYAWGGDYVPPTIPDAMHHEFMGTPAQAVAATDLARAELAGGGTPPPVAHPGTFAWPLASGHYYGNLAGPAQSHGGFYAAEQDEVANIQRWLVYHGCTSVDRTRWAVTTWADGRWQGETDTAMGLWHDRFYPGQSYRLRCYRDDYTRLAVA